MEFEEVDILSVKFLCSRGCLVASSVNPDITCRFPEGAVTIGDKSFCRVSIQVLNIDETLVTTHMGKTASVTPVVTLEPMRRRFHKPITLTIPLPGGPSGKNKKIDKKNVRVLFSITGSIDHSDWQDITAVTCLQGLESGKVSLDTVVTGRFVIVCCDNSIIDLEETLAEMLKSYRTGGPAFTASIIHPNLDLMKAIKNDDFSALQACLKGDGTKVNYQNKLGQTALHLACKDGDTDIVEELLAHNADNKLITKKGNTALHLASYYGNAGVVQLLLERGCDAASSSKTHHISPLYPAILENQCHIVDLLLEHGYDMTWTSQDGLPLPLVAVFSTYDKDKTTAMLELLLEKMDFAQFSLSPQLKSRGFSSFCEALLYCVGTRQAAGEMLGPLRQRLASLSAELLINDLASIQTCKEDLKQYLSVVQDGDKETCGEMLSKDKFVNQATQANISGLHCACLHGHTDIAAQLVEAGAHVNLQSTGGFTGLYLAALGCSTEIVKCLLKAGADTSLVNQYGLKASDIAKEMGHIDCLCIIQDHDKEHPVKPTKLAVNGTHNNSAKDELDYTDGDKEEHAKKGCCAF